DDLVDGKIIKKDERDDFIDYMDGEGYSEEVQLGKFKVDSEMDFKELAKTFITYPGDEKSSLTIIVKLLFLFFIFIVIVVFFIKISIHYLTAYFMVNVIPLTFI